LREIEKRSMKEVTIDKTNLADICTRNDIEFLGVFGSYARGDHTSDSDIDLLVRLSKRKSLLDLVRIERELSERLGRKVDLLTENSISPYLRDTIQKELRVIYDQKG